MSADCAGQSANTYILFILISASGRVRPRARRARRRALDRRLARGAAGREDTRGDVSRDR